MFFTTVGSTPAAWRPHVDFEYGLELKITISPPDCGTFDLLQDAQAWCLATIKDVRFPKELVKIHALNVHLSHGFGRGMNTLAKRNNLDAHPNSS